MGIRRAESKARADAKDWEWSDRFDCEVWRPIASWTEEDVRAIHARHGLAMNPLYEMGASRVGCWPCIHARKAEIALVAKTDPARIDEIEALENELNAMAAEKYPEGVEHRRTFFSYGGGGRKHYPLSIREAVAWANSKRGEWQPPNASDGCARFGFCETEGDETRGR